MHFLKSKATAFRAIHYFPMHFQC